MIQTQGTQPNPGQPNPGQPQPFTILMADDDAGDRLLAMEALEEARVLNPVRFVQDGEELLQYLRHSQSRAPNPAPDLSPDAGLELSSPRPGLILLDLNMPRKDGREALAEIRADPDLRHIAVVVMTTSRAEEDRAQASALGASGFIIKPVTFDELVQVMKTLGRYGVQFAAPPAPT